MFGLQNFKLKTVAVVIIIKHWPNLGLQCLQKRKKKLPQKGI